MDLINLTEKSWIDAMITEVTMEQKAPFLKRFSSLKY